MNYRKSCACFYDGNDLYAAGGATAELDQLSSVEKYDSNSQRWELVDNLPKGNNNICRLFSRIFEKIIFNIYICNVLISRKIFPHRFGSVCDCCGSWNACKTDA